MRLNAIFTSNMVFAANKPIRIYGEGDGIGELYFANLYARVESIDGKWIVELPEMDYGGPFELRFIAEGEEILLDDIYVGEVYLLSGQSNIQFKIRESRFPIEQCEANDLMRVFGTECMQKVERFAPKDGWMKCALDTVGEWSAIGYHMAHELVKRKNVAIGVVNCYQGASVIQSWMPKGAQEKLGISIPPEELFETHNIEAFKIWNYDGALYDYAFSQVVPFSFSGVVWYQGESNSSPAEAKVHELQLEELINVWRADLMDESLPFIIVQIANYSARDDEAWHMIQEAQMRVGNNMSNTKTVVSADVCEDHTVHPKTKTILSKRIADAACELVK